MCVNFFSWIYPYSQSWFPQKWLLWSTFRLKIISTQSLTHFIVWKKINVWYEIRLWQYHMCWIREYVIFFSFSVAKPADFVPFRQAYMYQCTNVHISAHIQNRLWLWVFIFLVRAWGIMWCIFHFDVLNFFCFASLPANISVLGNWAFHCIVRFS